ncbi:MAG: tRNA (adenosine(37)-N6)-threonylcarbamoyltransferase complex transferase subunit TsaD, partial [Chloroflexota bacterium]
HVLAIVPIVERALAEAAVGWGDLSAVAVTYGPGLAGSLLVGVNAAKGLALANGLPLVQVNHLEGHIYANWLVAGEESSPPPPPRFPLLCLVVSGGHTDLILMRGHGDYERLGRTRDDAAGEAFDKVARIVGLGYPGGPAIEKAALGGDPAAFPFPRARLGGSLDFSFSGLKTAVLRTVEDLRSGGPRRVSHGQSHTRPADALHEAPPLEQGLVADLASSFQAAVVDVLVEKTQLAVERYGVGQVALAGGVAANGALRAAMRERLTVEVLIPPITFCTDNAAIIASCGYFRFLRGEWAGWDLDVYPSLGLA